MRSSPRQDEYGDQFSALLLGSRTINQGTTRTISIVMHPSSLPGYFEDTLDILLTDIDKKSKFIITRKVEGTIRSKEDRALGGAKCT
ncbi:hypothetical protein HYPSUDRAFT_48654 [Hypholoma sublateritium FD-334 SS-4]|uniref:Uncharacterized protein n=1 Tax=Hypholoma sublateritium (strain FD-334 SS-4) TaxID=945553 RepID=A0A0D2P3M8_HYPSF|nr:hypothetical protein HYPSUDRAFT_48654 [Hypholoma sublateritium FD-334 SS-4]